MLNPYLRILGVGWSCAPGVTDQVDTNGNRWLWFIAAYKFFWEKIVSLPYVGIVGDYSHTERETKMASTHKINSALLPILDSALVEGNVVRLTQQLDWSTYVAVNKVLESIGGKWNRKAKGHVFEVDPGDVLEEVILTGEYSNKKQDFGFFETLPELAKKVIELADIQPRMSILEPSAGRGALVKALDNNIRPELTAVIVNDIQHKNCDALIEAGFVDCSQGEMAVLIASS